MILVSMHSINMHIQNNEDYKLTIGGGGRGQKRISNFYGQLKHIYKVILL